MGVALSLMQTWNRKDSVCAIAKAHEFMYVKWHMHKCVGLSCVVLAWYGLCVFCKPDMPVGWRPRKAAEWSLEGRRVHREGECVCAHICLHTPPLCTRDAHLNYPRPFSSGRQRHWLEFEGYTKNSPSVQNMRRCLYVCLEQDRSNRKGAMASRCCFTQLKYLGSLSGVFSVVSCHNLCVWQLLTWRQIHHLPC